MISIKDLKDVTETWTREIIDICRLFVKKDSKKNDLERVL